MPQNRPRGGPRQPASWEKYVKKYVWDDDSTPYFIPVRKLKQYQADKEIYLYCAFLVIPAALLVVAFVSALYGGDFSNAALGAYGASIIACTVYLKAKKSITAALFAITAPILLLLHFSINGFEVPDLSFNRVIVTTVDPANDTVQLATAKRWQTGYKVMLDSSGTLPAPLQSGFAYTLIKKASKTYQFSENRADARAGTAITLTSAGKGTQVLKRIVQLHWIEKTAMVLIVLLWLRYTLRVVAIAKAYPTLSSLKKDDNPWNKFDSGGPPPG